MYDATKPDSEEIIQLVGRTLKGDEPPSTTDGLGNKGYYHWTKRTFENSAQDFLAMVLNDAGVKRFEAKFAQIHMMLPKDDREAKMRILSTLVEECLKRDIRITSGETAIHEYSDSLEIGGSLQGEKYFDKKPNRFEIGDYLVGVESKGLMSNGFTKIREIYGDDFREDFTNPTPIYYDVVIDMLKRKFPINGMAHITGGAFSKLVKLLGNDADVLVEQNSYLKPPQIFYEIKEKGNLTDGEMYKTFNCGVGFILAVPRINLEDAVAEFTSAGFKASSIGRVTKGSGKVRIQSSFSDGEIVL